MTSAEVSIIIPTYNRATMLRTTLDALSRQLLAPESVEVIVVDDGAAEETAQVTRENRPLTVRYLPQAKGGATQARNAGALGATGRYLVFMDDDIEMLPRTLAELLAVARQQAGVVVLATLLDAPAEAPAVLTAADSVAAIPFTACQTGLLCVTRDDFMSLGMFQDPTGGWPNWDDVDFGYRAHRAGYRLLRSRRALAIHHDAAVPDWEARKRRWYQACRSAARLFERYPELAAHLPMFTDKLAVNWAQDDLRLVARKMARTVVSAPPMVWCLERVMALIERRHPSSPWLAPLRRWILGAYMFQGYRSGLRDLHLAAHA